MTDVVELFRFATSGFWTFVGCAILLGIVADVALRLVTVTLAIIFRK